ncbi:hypothetical protein ACLHDG_04960 [Sulfurovum sp. CS9]|uniref:hypothetical protein n=1 Tax=Sulfurovum sp. CS9 TaxID=3391146 RepID=UPI0039E8F0BB
MGKISYDHIQEILDSFSDKNKALETVKNLLVSNGYTEHHDEERLLFINSSDSHTHTIDIDLKKYAEENNTQKNGNTTKVIDDKLIQKDMNDTADIILKYHEMLEKNIITQEVFDSIKKDFLS